MGLTTEILSSVFWFMVEKFKEEKWIFVTKDVFVTSRFVTSTFVTSIQEIFKSFLF